MLVRELCTQNQLQRAIFRAPEDANQLAPGMPKSFAAIPSSSGAELSLPLRLRLCLCLCLLPLAVSVLHALLARVLAAQDNQAAPMAIRPNFGARLELGQASPLPTHQQTH